LASVIVGFLTGIGAVVLKNSVHFVHTIILPFCDKNNLYFFLFPFVGMMLTYIYIKISRLEIKPGIPNLLYSISKNQGYVKPHNIFSSVVGAIFTVGFGASGGLESPNITTGAGIGSFVSNLFKLSYRQRILLLGVAAAGTISAIFKAPITGIVFALEVIMIDLTSLSIIPIVLASVTASLTSYLFLGSNYLYSFKYEASFDYNNVLFYVLMGIVSGFFALFFSKGYMKLRQWFNKIKKVFFRFVIAGVVVGFMVYMFPAIFAEGYSAINSSIEGDYAYLNKNGLFASDVLQSSYIFLLFLLIAIVKAFTSSVTVSAGGIAGFFTPILFVGLNLGLFMSHFFNTIGFDIPNENGALVGMGGLISAMMHAPLSGVFFICELTGGYSLMMPLLITSSVAYITIRLFQKHNFFSIELANQKILLTHHADKNILTILQLKNLIENNFIKVRADNKLGDLVEAVKISTRDLFPVVDDENNFLGVVSLNRIRKIMFKKELYDSLTVAELMIFPPVFAEITEHLETVAEQFEKTQSYNLLILDNGKYVGFISRSNFFAHYRKLLKEFSAN